MKMTNRIAAILLFAALAISLGLNVFLYWQDQDYYQQLNLQRLDPLGLNEFSAKPEPGVQSPIVFFGDSRAADWPAPSGIGQLAVVNRGIASQTTAQALGRFQVHVAPLKPGIIVLQIGINDLKTIPLFLKQRDAIIQTCKDNIKELVDLSVATGARVILTTIFPLGPVPLERRLFWSDDVAVAIADVNAYIATLAGDRVTVFETAPILINSRGVVAADFSRDLLHLTPAGYAALNDELFKLLTQ